jgi:hypothetical protein
MPHTLSVHGAYTAGYSECKMNFELPIINANKHGRATRPLLERATKLRGGELRFCKASVKTLH